MAMGVTPTAALGGVVGGDETSLAVLAAGLVIVVGAAASVLWWWRRRQHPARRLRRALASVDEVSVLMHQNPDPDAMACAMAVDAIAADVDTAATLQYPGAIRHHENRAFRTILDLDVESVEDRSDLHDAVVLVDHNTPREIRGTTGIEPLAVVDHHPGEGTGRVTDVRSEYGACATIFVEYLKELDANLGTDTGLSVPPKLATALAYGIQADTNHLTKGCTENEFDATAYLYPAISEDLLDRIANPQVPIEILETKARAILDHRVEGSYAVCDLGEVPNVDAIPQAADELTHREGVSAVVVFGDHEDTVHVSGRSRDDRVHMGEALEAVVEGIPMASAGGHARMGGGQISAEHMAGLGPSEGVSREEFADRLFLALAGDY